MDPADLRGSAAKPQWLLIKKRDDEADGAGPVGDRPEFVVSGRTLEELG